MRPEEFSDERLRQELAEVSDVAGGGRDCPPPETLWRSGRDELDQAENETVVLHMSRCTACATAWKIARELAPGMEAARFGAGKKKTPSTRWAQLAAAAAIVFAVGASAVLFWPTKQSDVPVYREQTDYRPLSEMAESDPLAREQFVLRWSAGPEGTVYDVLVADGSLDIVDRAASLERPSYQVPETSLRGLQSGDRLFWQVTAMLPDGRRIESDSYLAVVE